jgi:flagellin
MISFNTNLSVNQAVVDLGQVSTRMGKLVGQMSSGLRVPSASFDPAGLAIATNFETQNSSLRVAMRNTNDGVSMAQTAEGATGEVIDLLQRMRELAVSSSSGTVADSDRVTMETEFDELQAEIDRIATDTTFNSIALTDGSNNSLSVQVGTANSSSSRISLSFGDLTQATLGTTSASVSSQAGAQTAMDTIDTALDTANGYNSDYGASVSRLDSALSFATTRELNIEVARSHIQDLDMAWAAVESTRLEILQNASIAALVQAQNLQRSAVISLLA